MFKALTTTAVAGGLLLGACAEAPESDSFGYAGTGIEFGVSPLTLDSLADACYSFAVENGAATKELVVGRGPHAAANFTGLVTGTAAQTICASQFGNSGGGDISYVAPCDADDGVDANTVTLWVDALCVGAVTDKTASPELLGGAPNAICPEMQDYVNPCGTAGCSLPVTCVENADTPVTFNFTIMGQADQGFFDVAVNFDDIFCSAKVDCEDVNGDPLTVLHNPNKPGMPRDQSIVLARACTAGPGQVTQLHLSDTYLACGYTHYFGGANSLHQFIPLYVFLLSPDSATEGNLNLASQVSLVANGPGFDPAPLAPFLFQDAVFHGNEALASGGTNLGKVYWNQAIGIDWTLFLAWLDALPAGIVDGNTNTPGVNECRVVSHASATGSAGLPVAAGPGVYESYPLITSDVVFWRDGVAPGNRELTCTTHPLDGSPGGLRSVYPLFQNGGYFELSASGPTPAGFGGVSPYALMYHCKTGNGLGSDLLGTCP